MLVYCEHYIMSTNVVGYVALKLHIQTFYTHFPDLRWNVKLQVVCYQPLLCVTAI